MYKFGIVNTGYSVTDLIYYVSFCRLLACAFWSKSNYYFIFL